MINSLKALYNGTIKPMIFGYGEGDNHGSRGEMQNLFMQHKIGTLMFDPIEWYKQLGTPVAQIEDNARIAKLDDLNSSKQKDVKEITEKGLREYLMIKDVQDKHKKYQFRSKNIPCVPARTEMIGHDFLTNSPVYMIFPMNEEEYFEAKRNRVPHYRAGNGRKKENGHSLRT